MRSKIHVHPYLFALLVTGAMFLLRLALNPLIGIMFPFFTFTLACIISAAYAGWRACLTAAVLGFFLGEYFFVGSRSLLPTSTVPWFGAAFYFLIAGTVAAFDE